MMKVMATGTLCTCWTYDTLFLIKPTKLTHWCWNI